MIVHNNDEIQIILPYNIEKNKIITGKITDFRLSETCAKTVKRTKTVAIFDRSDTKAL